MTRNKAFIRALLVSILILLTSAASAGEIYQQTFKSEILKRDYAFNIYLPDGYESSKAKYPVLYLLHGSGGNENDWAVKGQLQQSADALIKSGDIPPAIIIMPGSLSWWVNGYNEPAEDAFIKELIPFVDNHWRTISAREGRLIGGLSAGGYGTVNFILKYPELFGAAAAMSPAVYVPQPPKHSSAWRHPAFLSANGEYDTTQWEALNYPQFLQAYKDQELRVPLYINSGDHDTFDIAYHAAILYQALREFQPDKVEYRVVDGDHEWKVWQESLPEAMRYMFSYASRPQGSLPEQTSTR